MQTTQLVLLPHRVPLCVIVPAAQQHQHLTCHVSMHVDLNCSLLQFALEWKSYMLSCIVCTEKFKEYSAVCSWYSLKIFWSFLALQTTTVTVSQSIPLSSTGSASDNISLAVSLLSSPALSLAISRSTIAEVSSQSGFFTSSFSSSLSMSELLSFLYESVHPL